MNLLWILIDYTFTHVLSSWIIRSYLCLSAILHDKEVFTVIEFQSMRRQKWRICNNSWEVEWENENFSSEQTVSLCTRLTDKNTKERLSHLVKVIKINSRGVDICDSNSQRRFLWNFNICLVGFCADVVNSIIEPCNIERWIFLWYNTTQF